MRFQSHHQGRAQRHIFSFLVRTLDGVPHANKSVFAHCPSSFVKSRWRFWARSTSVLLVFCVFSISALLFPTSGPLQLLLQPDFYQRLIGNVPSVSGCLDGIKK